MSDDEYFGSIQLGRHPDADGLQQLSLGHNGTGKHNSAMAGNFAYEVLAYIWPLVKTEI